MFIKNIISLISLSILCIQPVHAQQSENNDRPMLFENLINCSLISVDKERLACFDKNIGPLQTAETQGDIVVEDRIVIEQSREEVFGLKSIDNPVFNGTNEASLQKIESKISSARELSPGQWIISLENNSTWQQTELKPLRRAPRPGTDVIIEKASFGGFKAFIGDARSIRVKRIR